MADPEPAAMPPLPAPSPFLAPPTLIGTTPCPSIIHLKRDLLIPVSFAPDTDPDRSSRPGARAATAGVLNTRFGDFPHSTLLNIPYGSQVRAAGPGHKRKRTAAAAAAAAAAAESGFLHILAPTAELWTAALPHRTQVVYTPDSAFILHKLQVRPGSVVLEAGAGSGSFTHAAVRAVYSGYPDGRESPAPPAPGAAPGRVWSFEFHGERVLKLRDEIASHGLDGLVHVVHRDVCKDGFLVGGASPAATAVFLDLPAPWLALPHLTRAHAGPGPATATTPDPDPAPSPLSPTHPVRICTFSPCIEQVTRTVSALRRLGWVEVEMHEVQHRHLEVRRAQRKSYADGAGPRSVAEALARLQWMSDHRARRAEGIDTTADTDTTTDNYLAEGKLVTRGEAEVKTHTSYLVFAVLPREWTADDEGAAEEMGAAAGAGVQAAPVQAPVVGPGERWKWVSAASEARRVSKRQMKKVERAARKAAEGGAGS